VDEDGGHPRYLYFTGDRVSSSPGTGDPAACGPSCLYNEEIAKNEGIGTEEFDRPAMVDVDCENARVPE
jgi:hypothetical protein